MSTSPNTDDPDYILAVQRLYFWQYGQESSNFTSQLYSLFHKADQNNFRRLALGFPMEAAAWKEWYDAESQEAFFEKYKEAIKT